MISINDIRRRPTYFDGERSRSIWPDGLAGGCVDPNTGAVQSYFPPAPCRACGTPTTLRAGGSRIVCGQTLGWAICSETCHEALGFPR